MLLAELQRGQVVQAVVLGGWGTGEMKYPKQIAKLDYSPAFQHGHPAQFELANKIKALMPQGLDHVFFTCSGSEAVDTALKLARAYWRVQGQGTKTRFIGRQKGYHGVNFGGLSVGGLGGNRKLFGPGVDADHQMAQQQSWSQDTYRR